MNNLYVSLRLTIIGDLAFTVLLYGLGPMLFAFVRKKPVTIRKMRWFSILYSTGIFFLFAYIRYLTDVNTPVNTIPALFWGIIFYKIAKMLLSYKGLIKVYQPDTTQGAMLNHSWIEEPSSECTVITHDEKKCVSQKPTDNVMPSQPKVVGIQANVHGPIVAGAPSSGPESSIEKPIPQPMVVSKSSSALKVFAILASVLFVAIMVYTVTLHFNLQTAAEEICRLEIENSALREDAEKARAAQMAAESKIDKLNAKYSALSYDEFFQKLTLKKIGYIYEGYKNYHYYECSVVTDADTYWAHNIEYCEYLGYDPCPHCWSEEK